MVGSTEGFVGAARCLKLGLTQIQCKDVYVPRGFLKMTRVDAIHYTMCAVIISQAALLWEPHYICLRGVSIPTYVQEVCIKFFCAFLLRLELEGSTRQPIRQRAFDTAGPLSMESTIVQKRTDPAGWRHV